ncbi:hypothetical protein [Haloglycomyces albus]|uniref:hypothetical protein n=1 Tax=Haloglycomyces albus TaxID=526067 RepID=UPI0005593F53|nr:hypothetical protein [Haloglycomyces albus]
MSPAEQLAAVENAPTLSKSPSVRVKTANTVGILILYIAYCASFAYEASLSVAIGLTALTWLVQMLLVRLVGSYDSGRRRSSRFEEGLFYLSIVQAMVPITMRDTAEGLFPNGALIAAAPTAVTVAYVLFRWRR